MRLVEKDSQRCRNLESSIQQLKRAKADMIRKQRDKETQHRDFIERKNKELLRLRKSNMKDK